MLILKSYHSHQRVFHFEKYERRYLKKLFTSRKQFSISFLPPFSLFFRFFDLHLILFSDEREAVWLLFFPFFLFSSFFFSFGILKGELIAHFIQRFTPSLNMYYVTWHTIWTWLPTEAGKCTSPDKNELLIDTRDLKRIFMECDATCLPRLVA